MQTETLRVLQHPTRVAGWLQDFPGLAGHTQGAGCSELTIVDDLTRPLQRLVGLLDRDGTAWRAFTRNWRTTLYVGEMMFDLSRERGRPVMRLTTYDEDARVLDTHDWIAAGPGRWMPAPR